MDLTADDVASENLQRIPSAASQNTTEPRVQASEAHSLGLEYEGSRQDIQTRHCAKLDAAPDSPEAAGADVQAASTKEDEHASTNDIKDDASIDSSDLQLERQILPIDYTRTQCSSLHAEHYKTRGTKHAQVAAIYTEGLEIRVRFLEKELLELQYGLNVKERPSEASDNDAPTTNSPCANPLPLKIGLLSLKDWKTRHRSRKWDKVSILMATTMEGSSVPLETIHSNLHNQVVTHQATGQGANYDKNGHEGNMRRPGPSDTARLMVRSPWPLLLIQLLSGEEIPPSRAWIYPFKHIVVYEQQIRRFVELLSEIDVDNVEAKYLSHILNNIISEVIRILGPKRTDVEYSKTYISNILLKSDALKNHHAKVQKSLPENLDEELEDDTDAGANLSSSPVDDSNANVSERSNSASEASKVPDGVPYKCTCLKDARDHLQLFVSTIDWHLGSLLKLHKAIRDRGLAKIRFEHLWHLFQPGDLVVTSTQPHQAYRVIHISGGRPLLTTADFASRYKGAKEIPTLHRHSKVSPFVLDCVRFDFDGEKFGPVQDIISIFEYEEDRLITALDVYPIRYAEKEDEFVKSLIYRGQRFAEYHDFKHRRYEGLSLSEPQEEIESEVIVDFTQSYRQPNNANHKPQIGLQGATRADNREVYEDRCTADSDQCLRMEHNALIDDTTFDKWQMDQFLTVDSHGTFLESRGISQTLAEEQLILLPYRVPGFSLRSRKWVPLNIDLLQKIKESDALEGRKSGFDDLVIPNEYKRLVKALVTSHTLNVQPVGNASKHKQQFDLIRGKGKGLIILLHGVPGVGKTSTAESVASYTGRPLFPITCGDIGQTAYDVEKNLEAMFLLARKWGCVLLLDEADVFLAKREKGGHNIDRNALVSVFLRTLEYYSGILFLTTNRIGSFDEAFKSRIHISLYYAPLSESQTFEVWVMNLDRLSKSNRDIYVDRSEIETFAKNHWKEGKRWNGRQIRNAFQTAVALAEYEFQEKCQKCKETGDKPPFRPALEDRHFSAVAKTSAQFDDYLQSVMHGQTHEQKAQILEIRSDTYDPERGTDTPSGKKYSYQRAVRPGPTGERARGRESDAGGYPAAFGCCVGGN